MSVRYRPERDKWEASIFIKGKRVRVLHETKKLAQEFIRDVRLRKLGLSGIDKPCTIEEAFASFLATESAQKIKRSQDADRRFLDMALHFFKNERGLSLATEIKVEDLQHLQLWAARAQKIGPDKTKKPWSDTTVAYYMTIMKAVLNKLMETEKISKNPAAYWRVPQGENARRRPMTKDEFQKICMLAPLWFRPILFALYLTGARGASIAALTWDQVDFETATLLLSSRKGGLKKMKMIPIPIFPELREILMQRWNARVHYAYDEYVFHGPHGKPVTAAEISAMGFKLIKEAGLKGVVLYGLRHSLATDLLNAGVSGEVIRRLMGHSNTKQLQQYTNFATLEPLKDAMQLIRGNDMPPQDTVSDKENKEE